MRISRARRAPPSPWRSCSPMAARRRRGCRDSSPSRTRTMALAGDPAVRVRGLVKRYGALVAVDGVDLEVRRGACLGLLGPNGAGKTTTIEILEGLKPPDAGSVEVLGLDWSRDARAIQARIGVQ